MYRYLLYTVNTSNRYVYMVNQCRDDSYSQFAKKSEADGHSDVVQTSGTCSVCKCLKGSNSSPNSLCPAWWLFRMDFVPSGWKLEQKNQLINEFDGQCECKGCEEFVTIPCRLPLLKSFMWETVNKHQEKYKTHSELHSYTCRQRTKGLRNQRVFKER